MADAGAPLLEVLGAAKIHRVIFQRCPLHHQPVALRLLDLAVKRDAGASLRAQENRLCFAHACLEFRFHTGFYFDLCNFGDHENSSSLMTDRRPG